MARSVRSLVVSALIAPIAAAPAVAQGPPADTRPIVGIMYFINGAIAMDGVDYNPLSKGIAQLMIAELSQRNPGIRLVERERLQKLLDEQDLAKEGGRVNPETAARLGQLLGARHMLTGSFIITPKQKMSLTVEVINSETSEHEYNTKVEGTVDDLFELITQLGEKVNAGLKLPPLERLKEGEKPASRGTSRKSALRAALAVGNGMNSQDEKDITKAIAFVREAAQFAPGNAGVQVTLARLEERRGNP